MASITYEHVWKRFGEVVAVQDLDIFIEDKEFLVFVGPSGCGKSTGPPTIPRSWRPRGAGSARTSSFCPPSSR